MPARPGLLQIVPVALGRPVTTAIKARSVEQALTHDFLYVVIVGWRWTDSAVFFWRIGDFVAVFGNIQSITWINALSLNAISIDLHTITAIQVANEPIATFHGELAMMGGDVGKPQDDVAALAPTYKQSILK